MATGKDKLTARQARFVERYVDSGNATKAAMEAGYSKKTARSIGQENLTKPDIAEAIEALQKQRRKQWGAKRFIVIDGLFKEATNEENELPLRLKASDQFLDATGGPEDRPGTESRKQSPLALVGTPVVISGPLEDEHNQEEE